MALANPALPYGLRDVRLTPIDAAGALGTPVDLPVGRHFNFTEAEDHEELRGDDKLVAVRGKGPVVNWEIESGGISLDAWKVLTGGQVTTTGVTPNQIKTLSKKGTDARPYFRVEGQSIGDSGGDVHAKVYRCKVTGDLGGEFADGQFFLTSCSGQGLPDPVNADALYDIIQNETATAIP